MTMAPIQTAPVLNPPMLTRLREGTRAFIRVEVVGVTELEGRHVAIVRTIDKNGQPLDAQQTQYYVPEAELVSIAEAAAEVKAAANAPAQTRSNQSWSRPYTPAPTRTVQTQPRPAPAPAPTQQNIQW